MNYPVWEVPVIGSQLVIAIIAVFHVLVSHFAVGGGFYLPMVEALARERGDRAWRDVVKKHSKFFLVFTAVFGTITGVGIWFSIGLANPEATSTLIHYFVFGWAMEWVVFLIELTTIAVYYYTWDRIPDKLHLLVGWLYAIAAWLTLVIINGILCFMLTPGDTWVGVAGSGQETHSFWSAFFNPTYWPSLVIRTLFCLCLAGCFALLTASRIDGEKKPLLKTDLIRWSVRWLMPIFILLPFAGAWYLWQVPAVQRHLLELGFATIGPGAFSIVTRMGLVFILSFGTLLAIVYLLAYRNPLDFKLGAAIVIILLMQAAIASTEMTREMLRKPFVIARHMYSNGVRLSQVGKFNAEGYLTRSAIVRAEDKQAWAALDAAGAAATNAPNYHAQMLTRGQLMFRGQCLACHTVDGYRSMRDFLATRDHKGIANILTMLHEHKPDSAYSVFMPPLVGTSNEIAALNLYLDTLTAPAGK
jgi:cytochrome bd-type quinol oxidase subunit 1/mono/diheme cytochrome c family protein